MFKEFALDPSLIRDWASFDRFVNRFSWAEGRVLSRVPRHWEREAMHSVQVRGKERTKIVERLRKTSSFAVERTAVAAESGGSWYNIVKTEHARQQFAAAISRVNPEGADWVMRGDTFDSADPRFCPLGCPVARTANAFADALAFLLSTANQVHFVDPHFQPAEPRFREPMERWLDIACRDSILRSARPDLFLHTTYDHKEPMPEDVQRRRISTLVGDIRSRLPGIVPKGIPIRVLVWDALDTTPDFHNRFILTDRAGVMFGIGLDQRPRPAKDEDIVRLPTAHYAERMRLYNVTEPDFMPTFTDIDDITLVGTRVV